MIKCRVLITGASGAVGPSVVSAFHDNNFLVRTFSLDPPQEGLFPDGIETIVGDITDQYAINAAMSGITHVVHMAALLHRNDPPRSMHSLYEQINIDGTSRVVDAALKNKVERIVFFSTIAIYGPSHGLIHSENTPPNPVTIYAKTKHEAEKIVLAAKSPDGQPLGTVLRLSAVYGHRVKGNYRRLIQSIAKRRFIPIGNGNNRRTIIYDKDAANAVYLAATSTQATGNIYNVTDGGFHTMREIIVCLSSALKKSAPKFSVPHPIARMAAGALEMSLKIIGIKSPVSRSTIDKYTEDMAVEGNKIQSELGFSPKFNLKQGWSEVIKKMYQDGEI